MVISDAAKVGIRFDMFCIFFKTSNAAHILGI